MAGNITEEQFKKFCKDFVEKYEGKNFKELIESFGSEIYVANTGMIKNKISFKSLSFGWCFWNENESGFALFGYESEPRTVFIESFGSSNNNFYTIEELYKFFIFSKSIKILTPKFIIIKNHSSPTTRLTSI